MSQTDESPRKRERDRMTYLKFELDQTKKQQQGVIVDLENRLAEKIAAHKTLVKEFDEFRKQKDRNLEENVAYRE